MMMTRIEKIYVDREAADRPEFASLLPLLPMPPMFVADAGEVFSKISGAVDPIEAGKQFLLLTCNKGPFIRSCPGTRHYTCCNYKILHIGTYCTMDCAYCILQGYFHPPVLQFFVNQTDMHRELDVFFSSGASARIGTGEFTDSLIWESVFGLSPDLVRTFANQTRSVLELKTKTAAVESLESLDHRFKTIVSWSLNTPQVIREQERRTTSLKSRLRAAAACESWGYPIGFHFDPMIVYDGCEAAYEDVIQQIFSSVSPENTVWISLGTLRFMPDLKQVIQKRFPDSKMVYGELVTGLDGKTRYFKPARIRLYKRLVECIRAYSPDITVYLCMEDDEVWQKSFGFVPADKGGLPAMLDRSAAEHCRLQP